MAKARRVSMSYQPGEWRPVAELLHRVAPHMSAAGAAKLILAQVAKDKEIEAAVVTRCYDSLRPVTTSNESCYPDPARGREPCGSPSEVEDTTAPSNGQDAEILALWRREMPFKRLDDPKGLLAKLKAAAPHRDHLAESHKVILWWDANPKNRKTKQGTPRFLAGWWTREKRGEDKGAQRTIDLSIPEEDLL